MLGINASTLYRKLIAYGIEKPGSVKDGDTFDAPRRGRGRTGGLAGISPARVHVAKSWPHAAGFRTGQGQGWVGWPAREAVRS